MRLHVREEARVFAPPFSFLPRNCYRAGEFSCRPSLSPHQGGSERASSPTRGALFILGAASSRHPSAGRFSRSPPGAPHTPGAALARAPPCHGLVAELAPYAISFLVDFPDGIIADRERQRWPWRRITTGSGQTCALKPRPLATGRRALPTSSCSPQLDNSIWPAQLQDSTRSRCG